MNIATEMMKLLDRVVIDNDLQAYIQLRQMLVEGRQLLDHDMPDVKPLKTKPPRRRLSRSAALEEGLSRACPTCGADKGEMCSSMVTNRNVKVGEKLNYMHQTRTGGYRGVKQP